MWSAKGEYLQIQQGGGSKILDYTYLHQGSQELCRAVLLLQEIHTQLH